MAPFEERPARRRGRVGLEWVKLMIAIRWLGLIGVTLAFPLAVSADDAKPLDLAGTWSWQWKDPQGMTHRHVLEVAGEGTKLVARERFDDQEPVKVNDLRVDGTTVSFTVLRGDSTARYSGTRADQNTINGKVMTTGANNQASEYGWTATRKPVKNAK
jgi:hypothetical protein